MSKRAQENVNPSESDNFIVQLDFFSCAKIFFVYVIE